MIHLFARRYIRRVLSDAYIEKAFARSDKTAPHPVPLFGWLGMRVSHGELVALLREELFVRRLDEREFFRLLQMLALLTQRYISYSIMVFLIADERLKNIFATYLKKEVTREKWYTPDHREGILTVTQLDKIAASYDVVYFRALLQESFETAVLDGAPKNSLDAKYWKRFLKPSEGLRFTANAIKMADFCKYLLLSSLGPYARESRDRILSFMEGEQDLKTLQTLISIIGRIAQCSAYTKTFVKNLCTHTDSLLRNTAKIALAELSDSLEECQKMLCMYMLSEDKELQKLAKECQERLLSEETLGMLVEPEVIPQRAKLPRLMGANVSKEEELQLLQAFDAAIHSFVLKAA